MDPGAGGLVDLVVISVPASATAGEALRRARVRDAGVVAAGEALILREDLARADHLGLDGVPAETLARPLPVADARLAEVAVRRLLAAGAPVVVVRDRRGPVGAVAASPVQGAGPSLGAHFVECLHAADRDTLLVVAGAAAALGTRAYVAGGTVRDALCAGVGGRRDLDVVVEGDGLALARAVAAALGPAAAVVEHERFLTASVRLDGHGRIDVATARSERYERPGALPRVLPATIGQDLGRRDFTVNAMAVELASRAFALLDPFGGRDDVARRRLRVLHPLSFVEDPTRIFRAARYAARLGFTVGGWTVRTQELALRLAPYPALSGQRLVAELDLILGDAHPAAVLRALGAGGVLRLLDPRYRFARATARRLTGLAAALAWTRAHGLRASPLEVTVLALLADQPGEVAEAALVRLGWSGEPMVRLLRALARAPALLRALLAAARPSARAALLRECHDVELAWAATIGGAAVRAVVEWFVTVARPSRPVLGGDEVVALGVPRGAAVAHVLGTLRDARLDDAVADRNGEETFVRDWVRRQGEGQRLGQAPDLDARCRRADEPKEG